MSHDLAEHRNRPIVRRILHAMRRTHMYLGLLLFPWALLYGVTAFLFNHPTVFSDQPTATFGRDALIGTPLESLPTATEQAQQVIAALNERQQPTIAYKLAGEAKYTREFAFATVKVNGQAFNVLFDVKNGGGTVRQANPEPTKKETIQAPFAVGNTAMPKGGSSPRMPTNDGIRLDNPLHERVKAAVPTVMERTGFPLGEVTVTSVPDITFALEAVGQTWIVVYNPMTGSVSGTLANSEEPPTLGWRRFVLRLHSAHGYPGEGNARWYWAFVVDIMAFVLVFWATSGLLMWWQIKSCRWLGWGLLLVSTASATTLGVMMHQAING